MKKLILTISIAAISLLGLNAQFNTGNGYLSGVANANLGFQFQQSYNELILGLHLEGGYFIQNRWSVGGSLLGDFCIDLSGLESDIDFMIGPNTRYYLARDSDPQIYIFGFVGYGINQTAAEFYAFHHIIGAMAGPGINFFVTERLALDARATYFFQYFRNPEFGGSHNVHRILFEFGISIFFSEFSFEL
jgi:hypothetical protein